MKVEAVEGSSWPHKNGFMTVLSWCQLPSWLRHTAAWLVKQGAAQSLARHVTAGSVLGHRSRLSRPGMPVAAASSYAALYSAALAVLPLDAGQGRGGGGKEEGAEGGQDKGGVALRGGNECGVWGGSGTAGWWEAPKAQK